jgi:hypothetical protein
MNVRFVEVSVSYPVEMRRHPISHPVTRSTMFRLR